MGPTNHIEFTVTTDANSQEGPANQNNDTTESAKFIRNRATSPTSLIETKTFDAEDQNFIDNHKKATNESEEEANLNALKGRRSALRLRALVPVFACHVCFNAGTLRATNKRIFRKHMV